MQNTYTQSPQALVDKGTIEMPEKPALAPGVQLVGELPETGFADKQWLAVRNGKFIQLGELLYRVAKLSDGERTLDEIAQRMTDTTEWTVTADHVRQILLKMIPLGIIATQEGNETIPNQEAPARQSEDSTLGITMRTQVIGPHVIQPIARALQAFYQPALLVPILIIIAVAHAWLYLEHGLSQSFMDILYRPWGFPIVLGLLILAGIFHEFGHAAALVYGGGHVRGMGAGMYLIYPAFYTDLTDSYRLSRWARVRTDLGGFYFYLIFALGIIGLYFLTRYEFLLLTVLFINLDVLYQSLPFVRLDGYWVMADLAGIPDPMTYMKPFLASMIPVPGKKRQNVAQLKPHIRRIFLIYSLLTIPLLIAGLVFIVYRLPGFVMRLYDSIAYQLQIISLAWQNGDIPGVIILALTIFLLLTMLLGSLYIFFRITRGFIKGLWNWSKPTPNRRVSGAALAMVAVALVSYNWMPYFQILFKSAPKNVQTFEVASREHTAQPVTYDQSPPVGGDHAPIWQNCGFYDTPIQSENAVHSMEHGAVWVTFRPDLPDNQVATLRKLAYRQPYVLVSPYSALPAPVVASAWGMQLHLESANDLKLEQFIRAYRLGERAPERGEPCIDGFGSPK
jgi:putative peptide zinc metalloprotease protein